VLLAAVIKILLVGVVQAASHNFIVTVPLDTLLQVVVLVQWVVEQAVDLVEYIVGDLLLNQELVITEELLLSGIQVEDHMVQLEEQPAGMEEHPRHSEPEVVAVAQELQMAAPVEMEL
jgi:hypothetical protein